MKKKQTSLWAVFFAALCLSVILTACGGGEKITDVSETDTANTAVGSERDTEKQPEQEMVPVKEPQEEKEPESGKDPQAESTRPPKPEPQPERNRKSEPQEESQPQPNSETVSTAGSSSANDQAQMTAIVKEVEEEKLLVSSRSDQFPGAYYVYFGEIEIDGIEAGDEIIIYWNGDVLETLPAQIYAESVKFE